MTVYHVQYWAEWSNEHDCIHASIKELGFFLHKQKAINAAKKSGYPMEHITISQYPINEDKE